MSFSAVTTTGIYCRPGCPARPNAENVRQYELAAAAEAAGFRACLRCRPYRMDVSPGSIGPDLVCRAVRLVVGGALDDGTEADLARRLNVSSRHLRRLFGDHVGVTPDQLARSRRAHFARRLLDDTDLTISDVAFASGFGSVRQLNRACVEVFRATPTALRSRRRASDRLAADGGLLLRLPFAGPLEWAPMRDYFARRAVPGVEYVDGDVYRRTAVVDGDPGVLEVMPGDRDHLLLRAHLPHWEGLIHVVQRARRLFDLDADVDAVVGHLAEDPIVGRLVRNRPGLRVPGAWDPFEVGVRAIIGQQISVDAATTVIGRVVSRYGTPVGGLGAMGLTHCFPAPEVLAGADLVGLGITGARATAVAAFARAVAAGDLPLDGSVPLAALITELSALPGIGAWTANYLALRLGEADALPSGDLVLRRAIGDGAPVPASRVEQVAEPWRPWRAYAATHVWASRAAPSARVALAG